MNLMNFQFVTSGRSILIFRKAGTGKFRTSIAYDVRAALRGYSVRSTRPPSSGPSSTLSTDASFA